MKIQATDKTGRTHTGAEIKSLIVSEENGTPLAVIKETIFDGLRNYKILTPEDQEFLTLIRTLGYDISVSKI